MKLEDEYDEFVKKHPSYDEDLCSEESLRKIAFDFIELKTNETPIETKYYWLVFEANTGNREDCNVFYSDLVYCGSKEEAIVIASVCEGRNSKNLKAIKMKPKNIDTMNINFT